MAGMGRHPVESPYPEARKPSPGPGTASMEIGLSKRGDLLTLTVKGKIRLQNWRVLDKHLETLLAKGCKCLVMDLSGVTLFCSAGVGAILHNIKKFQDLDRRLLLFSTSPLASEIFQVFGSDPPLIDKIYRDKDSLDAALQAQGHTVSD
jgi:anti-anti-sigma factor